MPSSRRTTLAQQSVRCLRQDALFVWRPLEGMHREVTCQPADRSGQGRQPRWCAASHDPIVGVSVTLAGETAGMQGCHPRRTVAPPVGCRGAGNRRRRNPNLEAGSPTGTTGRCTTNCASPRSPRSTGTSSTRLALPGQESQHPAPAAGNALGDRRRDVLHRLNGASPAPRMTRPARTSGVSDTDHSSMRQERLRGGSAAGGERGPAGRVWRYVACRATPGLRSGASETS